MTGWTKVRAVCAKFEPWIMGCFPKYPSQLCPEPGIEVELMYKLLSSLRLDVDLIQVPYGDIIPMLNNGTADITCSSFGLRVRFLLMKQLLPNVEFTLPVLQDYDFLITKSGHEGKLSQNIFFSLLDSALWLLIAAFLLILILYKIFLTLYYSAPAFLIALYQSYAGWFGFVITILLGVYSNFLAIGLSSKPKIPVGFTSLNDLSILLEKGTWRVVLPNNIYNNQGSVMHRVFHPGNSTRVSAAIRRRLNKAWKKNPPIVTPDLESARAMVAADPRLVSIEAASNEPYLDRQYCSSIKKIYDESIKFQTGKTYQYLVRKDWRFKPTITQLLSTGSPHDVYLWVVKENAMRNKSECDHRIHQNGVHTSPLYFLQLTDLFVFWTVSILIGLAIMLCELVKTHRQSWLKIFMARFQYFLKHKSNRIAA